MMRIIFFLFCSLVLVRASKAQINVVPNPSFEVYDTCPDNNSQIERAVGWLRLNRSPDYYHKCAGSNPYIGIPQNLLGFQDTDNASDSGYAGFITDPNDDGVHEILGIQLIETLVIGQKYYVSFSASPGYNHLGYICFCNKFGFRFTTKIDFPRPIISFDLVDNYAQFYSDSIISDTTNWVSIKGQFIADSAYKYLMIGNFFTTSQINSTCPGSGRNYLYVDNICVSIDSNSCFQFNEIKEPKTKPNYLYSIDESTGNLHIFNFPTTNHSTKVFAYDSIGRLIYLNETMNEYIDISISNFSKGIYFIKLNEYVIKIIF